jgi:predicted transcriptional regulator
MAIEQECRSLYNLWGLAMSDKEIVIEAIRQLPELVTFDEIAEAIAIFVAIKRGERDVDAGRIVRHDDVKKRLNGRFQLATG